jgi:hypothetical protein
MSPPSTVIRIAILTRQAGNMSHLMPSGQDFFTQLKKQLATMDQTKSP